jgi:hypothetical protein
VVAYLRATGIAIENAFDCGFPQEAHVQAAARRKILDDAAAELDSMEAASARVVARHSK